MKKVNYIVYDPVTLKIDSTWEWMGRSLGRLVDNNNQLTCINITHPKHQELLAKINEVNGTDYWPVKSFKEKPIKITVDPSKLGDLSLLESCEDVSVMFLRTEIQKKVWTINPDCDTVYVTGLSNDHETHIYIYNDCEYTKLIIEY